MIDKDLLRRLKALKDIQDRGGTEAEMELATTRLKALLDKHNLDIGEIDLRAQGGTRTIAASYNGRPDYLRVLAKTVELVTGSGSYWGESEGVMHLIFFGSPGNVAAAETLFRYYDDSLTNLAVKRRRSSRPASLPDFLLGAAMNLHERAEELKSSQAPQTMEIVRVTDSIVESMKQELLQRETTRTDRVDPEAKDSAGVIDGYLSAFKVRLQGRQQQLPRSASKSD